MSEETRTYKCSNCGDEGHSMRTCPRMNEKAEAVTVDEAVKYVMEVSHGYSRDCPECKEDIAGTALVRTVTLWNTCDCDHAPYKHLIREVYHPECAIKILERAAMGRTR